MDALVRKLARLRLHFNNANAVKARFPKAREVILTTSYVCNLLTTHHFSRSFLESFNNALENFLYEEVWKRGVAPEVIIAAGAIAENTYFFKFYLDKFHHRKKFFLTFEKGIFSVSNLNVDHQNLLPVEYECERDSCTRKAEVISSETGNGLLRKRYT